jgi:hypothetical protein
VRRRNPDFDTELRRLERAASLGDPAALERLMAMRARLAGGDPRPAVLALMKAANKGARADIARINERQVGTVLRLITGIPELGIFPQLAAWSWLSRRKRLVFASRCGTEGEVLLGMTSCLGGSGEASHTNSDFWSPWFMPTAIAIAANAFAHLHAESPRVAYIQRQHDTWGRSFPHRHEGDRIEALTDASALAGRRPRGSAPRYEYPQALRDMHDELGRESNEHFRRTGRPLDTPDFRRRWSEWQEANHANYEAWRARNADALNVMPEGQWRYHRTFFIPTPDDSRFDRRLGEWCEIARLGTLFIPGRGTGGVAALSEPQVTFLAETWR